jgi:hypothetical protein
MDFNAILPASHLVRRVALTTNVQYIIAGLGVGALLAIFYVLVKYMMGTTEHLIWPPILDFLKSVPRNLYWFVRYPWDLGRDVVRRMGWRRRGESDGIEMDDLGHRG